MEIEKFFFDTYALVEIAKGNENYALYTEKVGMVVTKLNLMEFHYSLLRTAGREEADHQYERLLPFVVEVGDEIIKNANRLKFRLKERNLLYIDCIGYVLAQVLRIKFLTGDIQFQDLENVEYIK